MQIRIQQSVPLRDYTTLQVGGDAQYFTHVESEAQLQEAVAYAKEHALPIKVLGGGSNVLVGDEAIDGLVIQLGIVGKTAQQEGTVVSYRVGAGEVFDDVVAYAVSQGWWGLENLSHIPGSAGATPIQNVGAYGVEIQDVIAKVRVFDTQTEQFHELTAQECAFAYRDSLFKTPAGKKYIVTEVVFALSSIPNPQLSYKDLQVAFPSGEASVIQIREAIIDIRSKKFPDWKKVGTAGSFFKNPIITQEHFAELQTTYPTMPSFVLEDGMIKVPLGWILDKVLSLKGYREGNVGAYQQQALVLINYGGATAQEIESFANDVVEQVHEKTNIRVAWEVTKFS